MQTIKLLSFTDDRRIQKPRPSFLSFKFTSRTLDGASVDCNRFVQEGFVFGLFGHSSFAFAAFLRFVCTQELLVVGAVVIEFFLANELIFSLPNRASTLQKKWRGLRGMLASNRLNNEYSNTNKNYLHNTLT